MVIGKVYFYLVNRNSEFYQYKRINEEFTNYRTFNNWIAGCGSTIQNTKCDYYNPRWFSMARGFYRCRLNIAEQQKSCKKHQRLQK